MTLTASHRDLDLDVLEQLGSGAGSVASTVVADSPAITGCVVLATCNRFELYLDLADDAGASLPGDVTDRSGGQGAPGGGPAGAPFARSRIAVADAVARLSGLPAEHVAAALRTLAGPDVARHLFAVASGLDSMVVGEREVAGQVRRALRAARADGTTSSALERLFQAASGTARAVGARTGLSGAGRSVVGVARDLAEGLLAAGAREEAEAGLGLGGERFGPADAAGGGVRTAESGWATASQQRSRLAGRRALLVGTGSYAGASVSAMRARGVGPITVHSPSGRAQAFAAERGLVAVPDDGLVRALAEAELVVCCSGTGGPAIDAATVRAARAVASGQAVVPRRGAAPQPDVAAHRDAAPLVLVDLALRRDVAPEVADLPGVRLVDLATVRERAPEVTPAVDLGGSIVAERAAAFETEQAERALAPAVVALREHVGRALEAEVARLRGTDPTSVELTERALRRFAATLLHTPTVRAREHARAGTDQAYRDALKSLFDL